MRNKGFTLVELMVVVAIIIILAAILVPRYLDVTDSAKAAKCQANQRTVEGAAAVFMARHDGTMPTSVGDLVTDGELDGEPTCPGTTGTAGGALYTLDTTNGSTVCPNALADHQRTP